MNSNGTKKDKQGSSEIRQKKIFNKKKWREQKYSSKAKGKFLLYLFFFLQTVVRIIFRQIVSQHVKFSLNLRY